MNISKFEWISNIIVVQSFILFEKKGENFTNIEENSEDNGWIGSEILLSNDNNSELSTFHGANYSWISFFVGSVQKREREHVIWSVRVSEEKNASQGNIFNFDLLFFSSAVIYLHLHSLVFHHFFSECDWRLARSLLLRPSCGNKFLLYSLCRSHFSFRLLFIWEIDFMHISLTRFTWHFSLSYYLL